MNLISQYSFDTSSINEFNQLYNSAYGEYDALLGSMTGPLPTVGNSGPNNYTKAITFNSNLQQYVALPSFTPTTNGLSFAFWFQSGNNINSTWPRIFCFGNGPSSDTTNLSAQFNGNNFGFIVVSSNTGYNNSMQENVIMNVGSNSSWNHIVWTLSYPNNGNFSSSTWTAYVNGNLTGTYNNKNYPSLEPRNNNYLIKSDWNGDSYYNGSIADFRIYNSVLTQKEVTSIFTQSKKSPYSQEILDKGFNELYSPIFCNIIPSNNNYNTCQNCNFGNNIYVDTQQTANSETNCQNICDNNVRCTSYSYNLTNGNCKQYSDFPQQIFNGVNNINSGYNLNFPFNYNELDTVQQSNIKDKCALQYTNNIFTPKHNIDLTKCLNTSSSSYYNYGENIYNGNINLNYNPECVFDIYSKNNIPTGSQNTSNYISNNELTQSISDPIMDNYEKKYNTYIQDKVQLSNINNVMSPLDATYASTYFNNVATQNNILGNDFLTSISNEMTPLVSLTEEIPKKIELLDMAYVDSFESFENKNNSDNIFLKIIIIIIIIFIIFTIIFNIYK